MDTGGYVVLTFVFRKEARGWSACCEELGTATFASSLPVTTRRLEEAVELHLNTLEDVGERERFFREHNIEFHRVKPGRNVKITAPVSQGVFVQPHIRHVPKLVAA